MSSKEIYKYLRVHNLLDLIMNAYVWMVEQQPGHTSIPSIGRQNEWSVAITAFGVHICSSVDEHFSCSCATSTEESQSTNTTVQPEMLEGIKFGGWAQNRCFVKVLMDLNLAVQHGIATRTCTCIIQYASKRNFGGV